MASKVKAQVMKFVGKNNLLGSRFLEIIYFVEETSL